MQIKKIIKYLGALLLGLSFVLPLSGCGKMTSDTITVDSDGDYAYAPIEDADYYVVRFFTEDDFNEDGTVKEDARPALKQTLQAEAGTTGTFKKISKLQFGIYIPTIYGLYMDKTTTKTVVGEPLVIGGKLSAPEIIVQNDYGQAKVAITDKCFDDVYFEKEAVYGFTAEVYTNEDCSGEMVVSAEFGEDAEYIEPTNSSKAVWLRNTTTGIGLEDGTYYIRVKANGNAEAEVEDSEYSEVVSVVVDSSATDVKYCTGIFDPKTGAVTMESENLLEFGNGASMFTEFLLTDSEEIVKDGDLYTFLGDANCDIHLVGSEGDTSGEAYTCGPMLMPIDKPDIRGTWVENADGTITVTFMADYQYYTNEADKKTT